MTPPVAVHVVDIGSPLTPPHVHESLMVRTSAATVLEELIKLLDKPRIISVEKAIEQKGFQLLDAEGTALVEPLSDVLERSRQQVRGIKARRECLPLCHRVLIVGAIDAREDELVLEPHGGRHLPQQSANGRHVEGGEGSWLWRPIAKVVGRVAHQQARVHRFVYARVRAFVRGSKRVA